MPGLAVPGLALPEDFRHNSPVMYGYHTHSHFCDGRGSPEEYLRRAEKLGFRQLGFSSHAPLPFEADWAMTEEQIPAYQAEIARLRAAVRQGDRPITILQGMELDYLGPRGKDWARRLRRDSALDYAVLSVHILPGRENSLGCTEHLSVDNTPREWEQLIDKGYGGSVQETVEDYYRLQAEAAETGIGEILGHFDLVKKLNRHSRYFREDEPWYRRAVEAALERIAQTPVILEVNTGGMARGKTDTPYPAPWIIRKAAERHIPFTLTADAHRPEHLAYAFGETVNLLAELGVAELMRWSPRGWQPGPAEDFIPPRPL